MSRILFVFSGCVMCFSWLMPGHYFPWASAHQDFSVFFAVLLLLFWCLYSLREFKVPVYFMGFIFIAAIPFLQYFLDVIYFFGDALIVSIYILGFLTSLLVGYNLSIHPSWRVTFVRVSAGVLALGGVLSAWIGMRQWLLLSGGIWVADLPLGARPFANLGQPNNLATLLCMGCVGILYFYETRCLGRLASSALVIFLLLGVVLSQSRTPWVGAVVLAFFWFWKLRAYKSRLSLGFLLLWLSVYFVGVLLFPLLGGKLQMSVADLVVRVSSFDRLDIWMQLFYAVLDRPWLGYGWNQVSVAQVSVSQIYLVPIMTEHSHNFLLDFLVWNGVLLGVGLVGYLSYWLLRLGCNARSAESIFGLLVCGFVLVHGVFEYPLEYAYFLLPVGLLLGMVTADIGVQYEVLLLRWMLAIIVVIGCFGWAFVWYEYSVIDEDYRLMRFESARIGNVRAEQVAPDIFLLTQLREYIRFVRTPVAEGMTVDDLDWMRKVAYRYPYIPSLFRYSLALGLNGDVAGAQEHLYVLKSLYGSDAFDEAKRAMLSLSVRYPELAKLSL